MSEQTEIREIHEADAEAFLDLLTRVDAETDFMLLEAGERATTVVEQRERIKGILSKESPLHCVGKLGEIPWHRASRADGADGQREGTGLYRKMGFEIEGVKRRSLKVKGAYVNEYYMAKILDNEVRQPISTSR